MVVLHPSSRMLRAPWPHDATLNGYGVRLGTSDRSGTVLVGEIPPDQGNVAPVEFGEQAKNPIFGGVVSVRDLSRGYGQRRLRGDGNGRYWYTVNARARAGYAIVGPALTEYTPATRDATAGVTRWFEIGGRIFALNGRYCLSGSTDGTGWTVSKDFGSGKAATDVVVARTNQSGSTRYAYVGMGDSENAYTFDGATATTTWTQRTFAARAWAVDPTTLYFVNDTNKLWTVDLDADATATANHASATDRIGTKDYGVTRMALNAAGGLLVAKEDDVYTLNADGSVNRLFAERQFVPSSANGEAMSRWGNDTYLTFGNATHRLSPDGGLSPVGPEVLQDNGSPVAGYLTAHCGTDFFLLAGLYNPDTGSAYLMEFTGDVAEGPFGRPEPVWHGSITAAFSGKRITSVHQSTIGAPTGHKMAYLGFSDGTIAKYVLACTPDPADCDEERYAAAAGELYYSRFLFHFPGQRKSLLAVTGEADNWSAFTYADFSYRLTQAAAYGDIGTPFNIGERTRVPFAPGESCTALEAKVDLVAAGATATPKMTGLSLEYQLRTLPQEVMLVHVLAEDGLTMRDGTPYRRGAWDIRNEMARLASLDAGATFVDPMGEEHLVTVMTPSHATAYDLPTRQAHDAVKVMLIERAVTAAHGGLQDVGQLTLTQMGAYTLTELGEIGA